MSHKDMKESGQGEHSVLRAENTETDEDERLKDSEDKRLKDGEDVPTQTDSFTFFKLDASPSNARSAGGAETKEPDCSRESSQSRAEKQREATQVQNVEDKGHEKESSHNTDKTGDKANGANDVASRKPGMAADVEAGAPAVSQPWKVPDGGWGWVIVVCALLISLIVDGLTYTFGLFLEEFERAFQQPKSTIALASSLQVGIYLFIGPIVSVLTNRFGCRPVIIGGSIVATLAFVLSSWSTNVTMLIMTYGVVGGVGFGLMYLPAIVAVSIYFEERRALATGIAVCGSGIGMFLLAPLTDYLLYEYSWNWTLLLLGGLILNGVVFGSLVRPLELQKRDVQENKGKPTKAAHGKDISKLSTREKNEEASLQGSKARTNLLPEEVSLINPADNHNKPMVTLTTPQETAEHDNTRILFFSSTPNMFKHSSPQLSQVELKKMKHKSSEAAFLNNPEARSRARSNTLDRLFRIGPASPTSGRAASARPHAHAPLGLAFISLSDANINKIRDDIHVPLPRKDIHLSGPLTSLESDTREDKGQGVYVQSMRSISSLATKDGLKMTQLRGIWSCLPASARETMEEMLDLRILKDKRYWFVLMGNFLCMIGFYVPFVYVPDMAQLIGISEEKAAFLLSIIGITNTIGRVLTGIIINFLNIDCVLVTTIALALAGVMTAACPMCMSYPSLAAVSAIFGICVAAYISLCSVMLCDLLGVENLTNAFGFVILFRGIACIMGPPIAGAIIDATGVFDPSFYVGGGMIFLGALSHAFLLLPSCRRRKSSNLPGH